MKEVERELEKMFDKEDFKKARGYAEEIADYELKIKVTEILLHALHEKHLKNVGGKK